MKIGFDLDKVFVNYPPIIPNFIIDKLYKEKDNGELKYKIPGTIEQKIRNFSHMPILGPLIKENVNFLKKISKNPNYELYLITSRFSFLKKRTNEIAQKIGFDKIFKKTYTNINNQQPHIFKERIIKKEKIEIYFDDDLSTLKFIAKKNPNIILFWLTNDEKKNIPNNIYKIKTLDDFLNHKIILTK